MEFFFFFFLQRNLLGVALARKAKLAPPTSAHRRPVKVNVQVIGRRPIRQPRRPKVRRSFRERSVLSTQTCRMADPSAPQGRMGKTSAVRFLPLFCLLFEIFFSNRLCRQVFGDEGPGRPTETISKDFWRILRARQKRDDNSRHVDRGKATCWAQRRACADFETA